MRSQSRVALLCAILAAAVMTVLTTVPGPAAATTSKAQASTTAAAEKRAAAQRRAAARRCVRAARRSGRARARALARGRCNRARFAVRRKTRPSTTTTTTTTTATEPTTSTSAEPTTSTALEPSTSTAPASTALFADSFAGPDGIITSADAFWNPTNTSLARDPGWEGESGTMYRRADSAASGDSRVFRFWTKRSDFGNVNVEMDLRLNSFHAGTSDLPAVSWDGVKIWLRRQVVNGSSSANGKPGFYVAEVNRRQGNVIIQKKCTGRDDYEILANTPWSGNPNPAKIGQWERVGGTVHTNADGSVSIGVIRDGQVVLTATDTGSGLCAPIGAGKVGVRGDNADFNFDNVSVTAN